MPLHSYAERRLSRRTQRRPAECADAQPLALRPREVRRWEPTQNATYSSCDMMPHLTKRVLVREDRCAPRTFHAKTQCDSHRKCAKNGRNASAPLVATRRSDQAPSPRRDVAKRCERAWCPQGDPLALGPGAGFPAFTRGVSGGIGATRPRPTKRSPGPRRRLPARPSDRPKASSPHTPPGGTGGPKSGWADCPGSRSPICRPFRPYG
jgi:hypothetical protein